MKKIRTTSWNDGHKLDAKRERIDGFIVPAKDSNALASATSKILADKELAPRMGHGGEAKVREKLTRDAYVALMKEILRYV